MTLEQLIAALEQATGPDWELDLAIARWCFAHGGVAGVDYDPELWRIRNGGEFTSSIDAALTLVPERCLTRIRELWDSDGKAAAATVSRYTAPPNMMWDWEWHGFAPTPAIALCIAALKARTS